MSLTFNSHIIMNLELSYPREGVWVAEALFWNDDAPTINQSSDIVIDDVKLNGIVKSISSDNEYIKCQIVGGKGSLSESPNKAKNLTDTNGKKIIDAILNQATDKVITIPSNISSYESKQWEVLNGVDRGKQLSRFVELFDGYVWRLDNSGNIIIVNDEKTNKDFDLTEDFELIETRYDGSEVYECSNLTSMIYPGMIVNDNFVEEVVIKANAEYIEIQLLKTRMIDILDAVFYRAHKDLFQQSFIAVVNEQNGNGTINVLPQDSRIKGVGIKNIPVLYSGNQRAESIPKNTKCVIGYASSDPENVYCLGFFVDDLDKAVNIFGNPDSAQPLALYDDLKAEIDGLQQTLDDLINAYNLHIHVASGTPGSPTIAPTTSTATTNGPVGTFNSTKIKAE